MARYSCPLFGCTLNFPLASNADCPVHHHPLNLAPSPQGVLSVNVPETGCFLQKNFTMEKFVPTSARGMFDADLSLPQRSLRIIVKIHCEFANSEVNITQVPAHLKKGYEDVTPWTAPDQARWMAEATMEVTDIWDNKFFLILRRPGLADIRINTKFYLEFVQDKSRAHVAAKILKIPTVTAETFNCGGTFVGLDQIIQQNPQMVSKAVLTSESGKIVQVSAANLGLNLQQTIFYNVMAHEFGHMIGLPDEYENPVSDPNKTYTPDQKAKEIHKLGTLQLATNANIAYANFGDYTQSLMSRGATLMQHHFVTVWEAVVKMTQRFSQPADWLIQ